MPENKTGNILVIMEGKVNQLAELTCKHDQVKEVKNVEELPSIKPLLDAAREYYQLHNVSQALFCYQQALEWEVQDLRLWKGLANCHYILGNFDKAVQYWEKAAESGFDEEVEKRLELLKSPSFQSWLKRMSEAVKTVEMKDYSRARDLFMDLLEEKDGVVSLYQILGLTHMACSDPVSARRVWNKGLQFDSSNPMLLKYLQSLDEIESGREDEKEEEMVDKGKSTNHLLFGSTAAIILGLLGFLILSRLGVYTDKPAQPAVPANQPAFATVKTEPDSGAAPAAVQPETKPVSRGAGSESERINLFGGKDAGCQMENKSEWQLYREGFTEYLRGDLFEARRAFGSVVNKDSGSYINRESLYYLARINYLLGDLENAAACFQKYLEQFAGTDYFDESLYYLGCIYHQTGSEEQARAMLGRLKAVKPDSGYLSSTISREILD